MSPDADVTTAAATAEAAELSPAVRDNLNLIERFADDDGETISGVQLLIERISRFFGSPAYFIFVVLFIVGWIALNMLLPRAGRHAIDPPPFAWLQGLVSCNALILTVAVLIRQNRMATLAEHRSHLDLQINLLAEQKATKVLELVNELHREVLSLRGREQRPCDEVRDLAQPSDPNALLDAIKQQTGESP